MLGVSQWVFWGTAGLIGLAVAAILVLALRRGSAGAEPAAAFDLRVYRDQLAEVDRDLARGVIGADDATRLRTEISRRVLEADRALATQRDASGAGARAPLALAAAMVVITGGAFALYWQLGAPGYPDMPLKARIEMADALRASRPPQAEAERTAPPPAARPAPDPAYLALVEKLRATVAARPDDLQGQSLLARNEASLGNFAAAHAAQTRVIALKGEAATAEDHAMLAELLILAAGGYVSPEAEAALTEALRRDPENGTARYYSGLLLAQTGRPDLAFALWRRLLEGSAPDAPWVPALEADLPRLAELAGVAYALPPRPGTGDARGPSAADMAAAADMTEEERQQMIRGMVDQLDDRLATEGGPATDWARLIGALGVLGETDRAREVWAEAQTRFAGTAEDLAVVRAAAEQAGVSE